MKLKIEKNKKNKKNKKKVLCVMIICLILAMISDLTNGSGEEQQTVPLQEFGEGEREETYVIEADQLPKNYSYELVVQEEKPTKEEAMSRIHEVEHIIDRTFPGEDEELNHITQDVNIQEVYREQQVKADWNFDRFDLVGIDGKIQTIDIIPTGEVVNANVELSCGAYSEEYAFAFMVYPKELSEQEELLNKIKVYISESQNQNGAKQLILPKEIDGMQLTWKKKSNHVFQKMFLFEGIILILLVLRQKENQRKIQKERKQKLSLDYLDILGKLVVLLESGMSLKQSWNKISAKYLNNRQKNIEEMRPGYEEMIYTQREMQDGEMELVALQNFAERTELPCYRRFVRILVQNINKGSQGLRPILEQEMTTAYVEKRNQIRKLGEEASTKMLVPMIGMLVIVIAIVVTPAIIGIKA